MDKLEEKDSPATKHPDYDELKAKRDVVRDVISGVDALAAKPLTYLPQYEGETEQSYNLRVQTATLNRYTNKAVKVLSGMVFAEEIEYGEDVPTEIKGDGEGGLIENIDKEGNHLNIFAQHVFEEAVLIDGYGAMVVDAPSVSATNKADQKNLDVMPFVRYYNADSIWNWSHRINPVSKAKELDMIDFKEVTFERDGFAFEAVTRYRVYELIGNQVTLQLWKENGETGEPEKEGEPMVINTTQIPTPIAGNLGMPPPLYDIALKNLEHYRTYSLMKSDAHKTCVPQRVIEGGSADSIAPIGGDVTLFPPAGMKAYFIEVAGTSLEFVRSLCKDIASDIAAMTNSIIAGQAKTGPQATATEEVIDHSQETAELKPMAESYKDTLENVFKYIAQFLNKGNDNGGSITLGTQWNVAKKQAEDQKMKDEEMHKITKEINKAAINGSRTM
jgi:hypothetical protein